MVLYCNAVDLLIMHLIKIVWTKPFESQVILNDTEDDKHHKKAICATNNKKNILKKLFAIFPHS